MNKEEKINEERRQTIKQIITFFPTATKSNRIIHANLIANFFINKNRKFFKSYEFKPDVYWRAYVDKNVINSKEMKHKLEPIVTIFVIFEANLYDIKNSISMINENDIEQLEKFYSMKEEKILN